MNRKHVTHTFPDRDEEQSQGKNTPKLKEKVSSIIARKGQCPIRVHQRCLLPVTKI